MSNPLEINVTEPTLVTATSDVLIPIIAKIEDALEGERQDLAFFSLLCITIINQYPGMTDEQIAKGIPRIASNIVQMCQEYEFENKLAAQNAASSQIILAN